MDGWAIDLIASAPPEENGSGLSRTVWGVAAEMVRRGHRVRVLYPSHPFQVAPPWQGVERVPLPVVGLKREPYAYERAVARAASELLDPKADLILANDEKGGAIELPNGRGNSRPVFGMLAHDIQQHHLLTMRAIQQPSPTIRQRIGTWMDRRTIAKLEGRAFGRSRAIVVASESNRNLLLGLYPIPPDRIHVIPHPVPPLPEVGDKTACRESLHIPLDVPVVAFLGRTPDRQGLPIALDAFRRVRVFFPGARFLVAGCAVPPEPGVMSFGIVDEIVKSRILHAADLFLFPARYEGYGLAPREAMRAGVATIVSAHVPIDGAVAGRELRVVAEDDPGAYASDLAELLADPAQRRVVAEAGRQYAAQFGIDRTTARIEAVFAPFLRTTGGGPAER
jgi:glycosyltransferase involved in cell wall biosynthesis